MSALAWKEVLLANAVLAVAYVLFRVAEHRTSASAERRLSRGRRLLGAALVLAAIAVLVPRKATPRWTDAPAMILADWGSRASASIEHSTLGAPRVSEPAAPAAPERVPLPWNDLATAAFLVALLLAAARFGKRWREVGRLLDEAVVVKHIGRVRIAVSEASSVPFAAYRFTRTWIVVPTSVLERAADFRLSLRHELEHVRQRDTHWAVGLEALAVFGFANPCVRRWGRRLGDLQELSCDARLVGRRGVSTREYVRCLLRVAEAAIERPLRLAGTTSMAGALENPKTQRSFLRRRIEMLSLERQSRPERGHLVGTVLVAALAVFALAARGLVAGAPSANAGDVVVAEDVQAIAESALAKALDRHKAEGGFVVVSEPSTGRVLAVADRDLRPGRTKAKYWSLAQLMRPASIVKPLIVAAAVDAKKTSLDESYPCDHGTYLWEGMQFSDWKPFDKLTTTEALAQSSNIASIKIAQRLGEKAVMDSLAAFGFGLGENGSASTFPGAASGRKVPEPSASPALRLALLATGGGVETTPLEIVAAYGAIANGGRLMKPVPANQKGGEELRRVISESTAEAMRHALERVLVDGTARGSASTKYKLAGKTGTAQDPAFAALDGAHAPGNVAAFAGFAPAEHPRLVVYVGIFRPAKGDGKAHGAEHAAPVFREVVERTLAAWKVPARS